MLSLCTTGKDIRQLPVGHSFESAMIHISARATRQYRDKLGRESRAPEHVSSYS